MRIPCPLCGDRDRREYYFGGAALARPTADAPAQAWDDYIHNRDNPAGVSREFWQHDGGCGAWMIVTRDTVSHAVISTALTKEITS